MVEEGQKRSEEKDTELENDTQKTETKEQTAPTVKSESASTGDEEKSAEKEQKKKVEFEVIESKDLPASYKEYKIKVPYEEYDKELSDILKSIQSKAVIEGFRVGKAPLKLIKIRFDEEAKNDALNKLLPSIIEKLVEQDEIELLTEPELKE